VRIFDNIDFGYNYVTVERPLKLNFATMDERIRKLREANAFVALAKSRRKKGDTPAGKEATEGSKLQSKIIKVLEEMKPQVVFKNREKFSATLRAAFEKADLAIPSPVFKVIVSALSEPDESADTCLDSKGNPEPDPEKRDYEKVPLREPIRDFIAREVLTYRPDAWIDDGKTKVGYEISFNRYFYQYTEQRPLEDIETELAQIETEISHKMTEPE
jgi:type I restriction enzyme M protein